MKIIIIAIILIAGGAGCAKMYSPQISNIPETEEGTIFIRCTGTGDTKKQAYENAIYNAFSTLLFQGIPESIQARPMVEPSDAGRVKSKVDGCIKDNDCYKNFVTQMRQIGDYTKIKHGYTSTGEIKINIRALRTYLEQNNIIRKFGF